jgi:GNAT superfamily N-acetyltransferase
MDSVPILDLQRDVFVQAAVLTGLDLAEVSRAEAEWVADRTVLSAEHSHWNWPGKFLQYAGDLEFIGISYEARFQGLMAIRREAVPCLNLWSAPACTTLYVAYLESAPWNLKEFEATPRFASVGTSMLRYAIERSIAMGCEGRIALTALPQAEPFYKRRGFERVGRDEREGLNYYELAEVPAKRLLEGSES